MNSLNPASHALTRPPSRPSAVRLSLACAFVALLGLAGGRPADGVNALGEALGQAMGVFAGELAGAL